MVRVVAEAQTTVIGDLRQIFIIKFFQTYVLWRPGEESKDRAPERATNPGLPGQELVLRRGQERHPPPQLIGPVISRAPNSQTCILPLSWTSNSALQRISPSI